MNYGYIRVSTDKQTTQNQRFEIQQYCAAQNLPGSGWIQETLTCREGDYENALTEAEDMQELINLQAQNKTVRQIADETGFAPTTVHRKLRKAVELGYKPTPCSVPFHTGVEQTEQLFK